jgi:hypothetical protein
MSPNQLHASNKKDWVAVVSGIDGEGDAARVIAHFHALQFVCKVVKSDQKEKTKIGFSMN